jgi:hypothetical protein
VKINRPSLPFLGQRTLKLCPQLVPKPLWGISAANKLKRAAWQEIRRDSIQRARNRCEACGGSPESSLICHEVWDYNDKVGTATLERMEVHCAECDLATHMGRAKVHGFLDAALERLRSVNNLSVAEAKQVFEDAMTVWRGRNKRNWRIVVSADLLARYPQLAILNG